MAGVVGRFAQLFDDRSHTRLPAPHSILIDSRDRDFVKYPTPSDYVITFPTTYKNVTKARLISAELPSSFYVFNCHAGNTSLKMILLPFNTKDIVIPDGNYDQSTFEVVVEGAMNEAYAGDHVTFIVSIDPMTLKTTITCSDASKTIGIDTTTTNTRQTGWGLAYYLGFPQKNTMYSGAGSLISPSSVSINPELYILISIDPLDTVDESGIDGSGGGDWIFAKVPFNVNSGDICFYDKQITCNLLSPPIPKIDKMRVRMRFHGSSELVDFNGIDHSVTLELECSQTR